MIYDFNLNNSYNYFSQIIQNKKAQLILGLFFGMQVYIYRGMSLHPKNSFVKNIGHDEYGTHCKFTNVYNVDLIKGSRMDFYNSNS